jgi:transposase
MIAKELQVEIKVLARQGKGVREIARMLGCSRKTVRRVLRGEAKDQYGPRPAKPKKLDPYVEYLHDRIEHAKPDRLAATVLLREIRELGYAGGYSQLKALVASLQPPAEPEPIVRFETEPGKQCQIDFVIFRRRPTKLVAFTAKLGWSRYGYAEFADNERVETLIGCLENAFIYFGRRASDSAVRQPQDDRDRPRRLRRRRAPIQPGVLGFHRALRRSRQTLSSISSANER